MPAPLNVLLCWEAIGTNSWNPVLAGLLRDAELRVTEVHDLSSLAAFDLSEFDVCLPKIPRRCGAHELSGRGPGRVRHPDAELA